MVSDSIFLCTVNGEDYRMLTPVQVVFKPMSMPGDKENVSVVILTDDIVESLETFQLILSSSSPLVSTVDGLTLATVTISDQSGE